MDDRPLYRRRIYERVYDRVSDYDRLVFLLGLAIVIMMIMVMAVAVAGYQSAGSSADGVATPLDAVAMALAGANAVTPTSTPATTAPTAQTAVPAPAPPQIAPALPQASIVSPAPGTTIGPGQQVVIESAASAGAGVQRIELWADGALYAATPNPNAFSTRMTASQAWSSGVAGSHALSAIAYDSFGQASAPATIAVIVGGAVPAPAPPAPTAAPQTASPPAVTMLYPVAGQQLPSGQIIYVDVTAGDSQGITRIELWVDGALYSAWSSPNPGGEPQVRITLPWQFPAAGAHSLYVDAQNAAYLAALTPPITVYTGAAAVPAPAPTYATAPTYAPPPTYVPAPGSLTGTWQGVASPTGAAWLLRLTRSCAKLCGTLAITSPGGQPYSGNIDNGHVKGNMVAFNVSFPTGQPAITFQGYIQPDGSIQGTWYEQNGASGSIVLQHTSTNPG